jgi:hypothetical protein
LASYVVHQENAPHIPLEDQEEYLGAEFVPGLFHCGIRNHRAAHFRQLNEEDASRPFWPLAAAKQPH